MGKLTISMKIKRLPPSAKKQAQDFVDFLYQRYANEVNSKRSKSVKISENPFFGIWKNRDEMSDSVKWVKSIRSSQWPKQ